MEHPRSAPSSGMPWEKREPAGGGREAVGEMPPHADVRYLPDSHPAQARIATSNASEGPLLLR